MSKYQGWKIVREFVEKNIEGIDKGWRRKDPEEDKIELARMQGKLDMAEKILNFVKSKQ